MRKIGGLKADLGDLHDGDLYICTDTNEIFLGTTCGNQKISRPERQIILNVAQSATYAPVITEKLNELPGVTFTGARSDPGEYTITASEALSTSTNKLSVHNVGDYTAGLIKPYFASTTVIGLRHFDDEFAGLDGITSLDLKIIVLD